MSVERIHLTIVQQETYPAAESRMTREGMLASSSHFCMISLIKQREGSTGGWYSKHCTLNCQASKL